MQQASHYRCPACGASLTFGSQSQQLDCTNCGNSFPESAAAPQQVYSVYDPVAAAAYTPRVTTKKEFLKLPENKKMRGEISGAAIICYVCAGITLFAGIAMDLFPAVLIDVAILVGMGLGIHLAQSRACAIILLGYSLLNLVLSIIQTGKPAGYLVVIAAVLAVIYTFKAEKAWKEYQQGGIQ